MEIQLHSSQQNLTHQLHQAFASKVDIYGQAVIKKESPLGPIFSLEKENISEINILFNLKGEIEGKVICTLLKKENDTQDDSLRSLFAESMNILLGQFLTSLENQTSYMSVVTTPELITHAKKCHILEQTQNILKLKTEYNFFTLKDLYPCHIFLLVHRKNIKEV